jgi:sulfotransferase famil protein
MIEKPLIVFLHIPRTGGITLRTTMSLLYDRRLTTHGVIRPEDAERADSDSRIEVVQGHFDFGIHEALKRPCRYVTLLRDPIDRAISQYQYLLEHPKSQFAHVARSARDLREWVLSMPSEEVDNTQTRRLSGGRPYTEPCSSEMLEEAAGRLASRQIEVFGLTERFPESLVLMTEAFAWPQVPDVEPENATEGRLTRHDLDAATVRAIESRNEFDLELYRRASALFDARVREFKRLTNRVRRAAARRARS